MGRKNMTPNELADYFYDTMQKTKSYIRNQRIDHLLKIIDNSTPNYLAEFYNIMDKRDRESERMIRMHGKKGRAS